MKNYYSLLGIDSSATKSEVKKNYRLLATKFHPDKNPDSSAATKFIEITEAYNVLSDKKSRAQYDLQRWQAMKQAKASAESFTTMVPPIVSLRTRRNQAQRIRGQKYQKSVGWLSRSSMILAENLRIASRYVFHVMGVILFAVILKSILGEVGISFEKGPLMGLMVVLAIVGLVYTIYRISEMAYNDFKKDMISYSVFFKLTQFRAAMYVAATGVVGLMLLFLIRFVF